MDMGSGAWPDPDKGEMPIMLTRLARGKGNYACQGQGNGLFQEPARTSTNQNAVGHRGGVHKTGSEGI